MSLRHNVEIAERQGCLSWEFQVDEVAALLARVEAAEAERDRLRAALRDIAHGAYDGDRCAEIARKALAEAEGKEG